MSAKLRRKGYTIVSHAVHVIPTTAALALVALDCKQYYIGGELSGPENEDLEKFGGLLFAAKSHEILHAGVPGSSHPRLPSRAWDLCTVADWSQD